MKSLIISQPKDSRVGKRILKDLELQNGVPQFDNFYIMVAYARKSGVSQIQESLRQFRRHGGKAKAIVGIDDGHTSKEGLELLIKNMDEIYVYHNTKPYQTFHPKLYVFEKKNKKAVVLVGSSNLTQGGLFSNYEISAEIELDLTRNDHVKQFNEILKLFDQYSNVKSPCCRKLDAPLLNELEQRKYIESEEAQDVGTWFRHKKEVGSKRTPLFGTESIPNFKISYPKVFSAKYAITNKGFWKVLAAFDVSKTSAPGQMIIPIKNIGLFPSMSNWAQTKVGAKQRDVYFDVVFIDSNSKKHKVKNSRAILYVPSPYHPRPNQELRFTFKDRSVLNLLRKGDILEFRRTDSYSVWFEIKLIPQESKKSQKYLKTKKHDGTI